MFLPPKKRHAIAITSCLLATWFFASGTVSAQETEFNRRMAAMQQARARVQQPTQETTQSPDPVPAASATPVTASPQSVVRPAAAQMASPRVAAAPRRSFVPRHLRTAQVMEGTVIDGGSPIVSSAPMMAGQPVAGSTVIGSQVIEQSMISGGIVPETVVQGSVVGCDSGDCGGCDSCGVVGGYFDDDCCGRGGCPPGTPCWLDGLGTVFRNAEFYSGFTSFRSALFTSPLTNDRTLADDCSHGYYGGVNVGIPLCRLSCGLLSGQFGVRTVNTNFNGNAFSQDSRNQLFFTAGFYRRVDYGFQFGVVADVLREEWYANSDLVQIRGDLGYVWPAGSTFGFRFATNVQDDVVNGTFNGVNFTGQGIATDDNYRFYLRHDAKQGGFGEVFAGWSETNQGIIGMDFDMPITDRVAFEAGFTYYLNDEGIPAGSGLQGGNQLQAYNVYVGMALRPRGRKWYRSYDRPLFDVADNGSMLTIR